MFGYSKEAIRVKVKKCEGKLPPEQRKFSVDPQITSLEVLQSILVKAFDIKSDFTLTFRTTDDYGQEIFLPILSDWDLDATFLKAHNTAVAHRCEPCVQLRVDMKPFSEDSDEWEPPSENMPPQVAYNNYWEPPTVAPAQFTEKEQTGFQGLIMNHVEKTFNMVSRALNLHEAAPRPPLSDAEFRALLDPAGHIAEPARLREAIYCGGIDPSLRKVVWKHILNVYPDGMTGKERMDYIKRKANEYYVLKAKWKDCVQKGKMSSELAFVTGMVRKDVLRTDRHLGFYAGPDDNRNVAALFNVLTTYAMNHPSVSYCQGMSDLASPLLVTMGDEAHAYVCLCALMSRLRPNFLLDGEAMTLKFAHLTEALQVYDPDFFAYLKSQQADDLLFCYRWLLLEMKREFAFDDALTMLEVLWASLPPRSVAGELALSEPEPGPAPAAAAAQPAAPRETAYTKLCAIRRQSSSFSLANKTPKLSTARQMNHSLDDSAARHEGGPSLKHSKEFQSLDDAALQVRHDSDKEDGKKEDPKENSLILKECKLQVRNAMRSVPANDNVQAMNGIATTESKETPLVSQVRLLRDKISMHNNKYYSAETGAGDADAASKPKVKMIKNLSEFFNLTTGLKSAPDRLQRARSVTERPPRRAAPARTSYDESDLPAPPGTAPAPVPTPAPAPAPASRADSSPDDSQEYYPMTTSMTRELRLELEHLDRQVFGAPPPPRAPRAPPPPAPRSPGPPAAPPPGARADDIYLWENPLHCPAPPPPPPAPRTPDEQADLEYDGDIVIEGHHGKSITPIRLLRRNNCLEARDLSPARAHSSNSDSSDAPDSGPDSRTDSRADMTNFKTHKFFSSMSAELENARRNCESLLAGAGREAAAREGAGPARPRARGAGAGALPPPTVFGGGNPFLMFLCLTVLLQHRDHIMRNRMDYNELAMHFDKMVRKHDVTRVLTRARSLYAGYLKLQAPAPHVPT